MRDRPWIKWVGIVLCFVLLAVMLIISNKIKSENAAEREKLWELSADYENTLRPLWDEKARLEKALTDLDEEEKVTTNVASPVAIICTEPDEQVMTVIEPTLTEKGYTAAITLWDNKFPGDEGCISGRDMLALSDAGWEICLGAYAETDIAELYNKVVAMGYLDPVAVYFPEGDYTAEQEAAIAGLGIKAIVTYGTDSDMTYDDVWYAHAYGSNESNVKKLFLANLRDDIPVVLTVGFVNDREMYVPENFNGMMTTFASYEKSGDAEIISLNKTRLKAMGGGAFENAEDSFELRRTELQKQLEEVNKAIDDAQNGKKQAGL